MNTNLLWGYTLTFAIYILKITYNVLSRRGKEKSTSGTKIEVKVILNGKPIVEIMYERNYNSRVHR